MNLITSQDITLIHFQWRQSKKCRFQRSRKGLNKTCMNGVEIVLVMQSIDVSYAARVHILEFPYQLREITCYFKISIESHTKSFPLIYKKNTDKNCPCQAISGHDIVIQLPTYIEPYMWLLGTFHGRIQLYNYLVI